MTRIINYILLLVAIITGLSIIQSPDIVRLFIISMLIFNSLSYKIDINALHTTKIAVMKMLDEDINDEKIKKAQDALKVIAKSEISLHTDILVQNIIISIILICI